MNIHDATKFALAYNPPAPIRPDGWKPGKHLRMDTAKKHFIVYNGNNPLGQYVPEVEDVLRQDWQLVV